MTTKVTITIAPTQERGIAIVHMIHGQIGDVHDVLPGQTGEFYVHSHQDLNLHEITPLEELPPEDDLPLIDSPVAVTAIVGDGTPSVDLIVVPPADPAIPVQRFINTVDSINANTTELQSGVIDPVTADENKVFAMAAPEDAPTFVPVADYLAPIANADFPNVVATSQETVAA